MSEKPKSIETVIASLKVGGVGVDISAEAPNSQEVIKYLSEMEKKGVNTSDVTFHGQTTQLPSTPQK